MEIIDIYAKISKLSLRVGGNTMICPFQILQERAQSKPNENAFHVLRLGSRRFDHFKSLTWDEVFQRVKKYGAYLQSLNLQPGDRVGIWSRNSAEWLIADWAIISGGFVSVPLYPQSSISEIQYILEEAKLKVLLVEEKSDEIFAMQIALADIEEMELESNLTFKVPEINPDRVATIIYTSGTCGFPKGVMHSLRNGYDAVQSAIKEVGLSSEDKLFSYLPLSHVAERILIQWGSMYSGAEVFILDRLERLAQFLPLARPTIFLAVPRVWETLLAKLERELESKKWIKYIPQVLKRTFVGKIVKKKVGLDRCRIFVSGAAKISHETLRRFSNLGIDIVDGYGLTETMGVTMLGGRPFPNVQIRLAEDGEMLVKASFHFLGYYNNDDVTVRIVKDGWLHTGDIAAVDNSGKYSITDRKKNIFKSSGGKYIAPWPIENQLKKHPAILEAIVIGENKPYCVAFASVDEGFSNESELQIFLEKINSNLAPHEQIKTLGYTRGAWSVNSGEMTATFKLKRRVILEKYDSQINELYDSRSRVRYFQ